MRDDNNLLSDVIEVIATDPDFRESTSQKNNKMFNGGGEIPAPQLQPAIQPQSAQQSRRQAYVKIIEQPASKALRFRYECEGRSAGSIPGASSTPENKTFPTIQIVGYTGRAVVVVSCVTKDPPHKPHPHNLVGREGCKNGVCQLKIVCNRESTLFHFTNLGVQCVKRKNLEDSLKLRKILDVDPFKTGFDHCKQPTSIDLNTVRLCFQVFLEGEDGKFSYPLKPVVSEPIYDKKAMSDLCIIKLSDCCSSVNGGSNDIILLCEKVAKEDIQVRFFEDNSDWEAYADFQPSQVHKQHAIWFKPPKYKTQDITEPVQAFIQLRRPSDGATSEPLPFQFLPMNSGNRKKRKIDDPSHILSQLQEHDSKVRFSLNVPMDTIKSEPRESTPSPYGGLPQYNALSPGSAYVPNIATPQYNFQVEPTRSPEYHFNNPSSNNPLMPRTSPGPQLWHSPSTSSLPGNSPQHVVYNIPSTSGMQTIPQTTENVFFDLDSRELNINSDEIAETLRTINSTDLPEIQNLSKTIEDICLLSNTYRNQ